MREKPFSFSTAEELQRRAHLDTAGINRFAASSRALTWPIVMHSATTDPVPTGTIRYVRENNHVTVWFRIDPGGVVGNLGTGAWTMEVPGTFSTESSFGLDCGGWMATRVDTGGTISGWCQMSGTVNRIAFNYRDTAGVGAVSSIGRSLPWDWTAPVGAARFTGFITYEAADAYSP